MRWQRSICGLLTALVLFAWAEQVHSEPMGVDRRVELLTRLERAAAFIMAQQDENGAFNESGYINTDSNMLYAMIGLLAAYEQTKRKEYLTAVEQGCRWLMRVQNREGDWHLSYRREKDGYVPALPKGYQQYDAVRGVDTTMALFIYAANELNKRTKDQQLRVQAKGAAYRAYQFLLTYNLDARDGLFWSSYHIVNGKAGKQLTNDQLYKVKYTADNAETYIGLIAAAEMFHDPQAGQAAMRLKTNFTRFLDWDEGAYAVMLDDKGKTKMSPDYARYFATGWSAYLINDEALFGRGRARVAGEISEDGSFHRWEGTYSLSTLSFLLGEKRGGVYTPKVSQAEAFLFSQQKQNGGIADDLSSNSTYINIAGLFLLYLSEELK